MENDDIECENSLVYIRLNSGHIWKLFEEFMRAAFFDQLYLIILESGIYVFRKDSTGLNLYDAKFPREKFSKYEVKKEVVISYSLKETKTKLKTIKKKDIITIKIDKYNPSQGGTLSFSIKKNDNGNIKSNVINVGFIDHTEDLLSQIADNIVIDNKFYNYPYVIDSKDLKGLGKSIGNKNKSNITIFIQSNNFAGFTTNHDFSNPNCNYHRHGNFKNKESKMIPFTFKNIDEIINLNNELNNIYIDTFPSQSIDKLFPMATLSSTVLFYSPINSDYPLKIMVQSEIGDITVFIKNKNSNDDEENTNPTPVVAEKKRKKKSKTIKT